MRKYDTFSKSEYNTTALVLTRDGMKVESNWRCLVKLVELSEFQSGKREFFLEKPLVSKDFGGYVSDFSTDVRCGKTL